MANHKTERHYDSQTDEIPLPPGMNAHWFAREGINVLLNGGVSHAEQLFKKFKSCSPMLSAGASLVDFITAAMTFEEEKMTQAFNSLKGTIKMCQVDSLFEGMLTKRPSEKWSPVERIERMIIWADCELFLAFLMFLKQSVVDFVKAGYHMRRAWKMYEKCHREIHGCDPDVSTKNKKSPNKKNKKSSRTPSPVEISDDDKIILDASLSFGYGLIQVAFSIVPTTLLKVCEVFGFHADRDIGLGALKVSSDSDDMKAPIARLTLLWYHTVVRPFCALDGSNIEKGLSEASLILDASEKEFPTSAIFLYFKALICRLRGQLEDALSILAQTLESSKEQREIALLCYYDKGWCHLMRLEWDQAAPCFSELRVQSRWSEAYYTYLQAVTEGCQGKSDSAYERLKLVPKLVVRKTQLENFLNRKATLYKKKTPTRIEYVVLGFELLYLWNALPQCSQQTLREMLNELESCSIQGMQPLKLLIMGSIYKLLGEKETSIQYYQIASSKPDGKPLDAHVVPYALYEIAMIHSTNHNETDRAKELLCRVKDGHHGYDFENRLNFRIHAALNNIEDLEYERQAQAKMAPPMVDGL